MLQNLQYDRKNAFFLLYNLFNAENIVLSEWRSINVVSILKPGKYLLLACLLSSLRKIMERMILNRLNQFFSSSQFGFGKGRGTRDCYVFEDYVF